MRVVKKSEVLEDLQIQGGGWGQSVIHKGVLIKKVLLLKLPKSQGALCVKMHFCAYISSE
jgi:hypothetical protein